MEGVDNTNPMLTLEEGENNNPFSSLDDKTLMMMAPSLIFSGDVGPSSSSCTPAGYHLSAQLENFRGGGGEMGGLVSNNSNNSDHNKNCNKGKGKRTSAMQRIAFHTRSDDDVLDDGYRWRKYGQKSVKNNAHPRFFYFYFIASHTFTSVFKNIYDNVKVDIEIDLSISITYTHILGHVYILETLV